MVEENKDLKHSKIRYIPVILALIWGVKAKARGLLHVPGQVVVRGRAGRGRGKKDVLLGLRPNTSVSAQGGKVAFGHLSFF